MFVRYEDNKYNPSAPSAPADQYPQHPPPYSASPPVTTAAAATTTTTTRTATTTTRSNGFMSYRNVLYIVILIWIINFIICVYNLSVAFPISVYMYGLRVALFIMQLIGACIALIMVAIYINRLMHLRNQSSQGIRCIRALSNGFVFILLMTFMFICIASAILVLIIVIATGDNGRLVPAIISLLFQVAQAAIVYFWYRALQRAEANVVVVNNTGGVV